MRPSCSQVDPAKLTLTMTVYKQLVRANAVVAARAKAKTFGESIDGTGRLPG